MVSDVPQIGRNWWLFVVLGVICFGVGVAAIVWPEITLLTLGILFGIYLLVAAILELIDALFGEPGGRAISAILGIVAMIAGLICIRRPGESLIAITLAVGIYLIAAGVIRIVRAFSSGGNRWWGIGLGAFDAVIGIVIFSWPKIGLVTLAIFFAATMLTRGIFAIVIGFKLRGVRHSDDAPPPAHVSAA